jgi:hypothetical protein
MALDQGWGKGSADYFLGKQLINQPGEDGWTVLEAYVAV